MAPPVQLSRDLVGAGTALFQQALDALDDEGVAGATALPRWTRAHVVAHVAANAEALVNLATWARTGVETPMYDSPRQRDADIEAGAGLPVDRLRDWFASSAVTLDRALDQLEDEHWTRLVSTAQGRTVPAREVPWMRTREVMVHAVDLDGGVSFDDLPADFLVAVLHDAAAKRSGAGDGPTLELASTDDSHQGRSWSVAGAGAVTSVRGPLAQLAAYLTGRAHTGLTAAGGLVPTLPRWL